MNETPGDGVRGWYVDREGQDKLRFWDGQNWTAETRSPDRPIEDYLAAEELLAAPAPAPASTERVWHATGPPEKGDTLDAAEWAGYIFAVLGSFIGLVIGLALIARGSRQGIWIVLTSIIFGFIWLFVVFASIAAS